MGRILFKKLSLLVVVCFILGCGSMKLNVEDQRLSKLSMEKGNHYYYYTISQLGKKNGNTDQAVFDLKQAIKLDPKSLYLKKELALLFLQSGNYTEATPLLQNIIDKSPDSVEALLMKGNILQIRKKYTQAQEAYEKVIKIDPGRQNIYLILGSMYMKEEKTDKAIQVYKKMVAHFPDSYSGYFFLGKAYFAKDDIKSSEKAFKKCLKIDEKLIEPRFELIRIYEKNIFNTLAKNNLTTIPVAKGDSIKNILNKIYHGFGPEIQKTIHIYNPGLKNLSHVNQNIVLKMPKPEFMENHSDILEKLGKAIATFQKILDVDPGNDRTMMELGIVYKKIGVEKESDKIFRKLGKNSLKDKSLGDKILFLFFDRERYNDAVIVLDGMLKGAPNNSDLHYLAGSAYDQNKMTSPALSHYLKVQKGSRFYENAVIQSAYVYQSQKKLKKGILHLKNAIKASPEDIEFYLYLGSFYEQMEDYENSEKILKKGLSLDNKNTKLIFRLGVIYDKWGKRDISIKEMEKVVKLDPNDAHALNYLGYTYLDLGRNLVQAEKLIKKAMKLKPGDGYITDSMGWLYYYKGKYEMAVNTLEEAVRLVPDDPVILEHLGDAYLKINEVEKAETIYKRALSNRKKDKSKLEKKIKELSIQKKKTN